MSNYIISKDVNKTLDSFGLTASEFKAKLNREIRCSGIKEAFPEITSFACKGISCFECPLSNQQDYRVLLEWLNGSRPREAKSNRPHPINTNMFPHHEPAPKKLEQKFSPRKKPSTEEQINNLVKKVNTLEKTITNLEKKIEKTITSLDKNNELIISILQQNNKIKEIK